MTRTRSRKWYQANRRADPLAVRLFPSRPDRSSSLPGLALNAQADLLLVDGDPLANIDLIADPARNFVLIMKDGRIYKNSLGTT